MSRMILATTLAILLFSANAMADFGSAYAVPPGSSSVVAPVWVEGEGPLNLVVSLEFLTRPEDSKLYSSDAYTQLLRRLSVKWKSIALDEVLAAGTIEKGSLAGLKRSIESAVDELISEETAKRIEDPGAEVVYSLSGFALVEPGADG